MEKNSTKSSGLRGQVAGETELCTVGKSGTGLTYRGYEINDLADNAEFEEVAFLLLYGHLPNKEELKASGFLEKRSAIAKITDEAKDINILINDNEEEENLDDFITSDSNIS